MVHISLRNLKTSLAVFICVVISQLFKLEYPFFVVVAAIISMENSLMNSFKAGRNRMLGTLIGAGIGLFCALIRPGSALLCGIGMILVIFLCNFLKWRKPIPIAGIVFIAVMVSLNGKSPIQYSINRIIDTFIGIVVAVGVNYLVFPPNYVPRIRRIITELSIKTKNIIQTLLIDNRDISLVEYEQEIVKANELWEISNEDSKIHRGKGSKEISSIRNVLDELTEIYRHLQIIIQLKPISALNQPNTMEIQSIFNGVNLLPYQEREDEKNIVLNYHVRKVLNLYRDITDFTAAWISS